VDAASTAGLETGATLLSQFTDMFLVVNLGHPLWTICIFYEFYR